MANSFQQKKSLKVSLDDTTTLSCAIETAQKKEDHIEYIIRVQRGPVKEFSWQIIKRYSDFEKLDSQLRVSNMEFPLPPKKVFGNFDREFIAERQNGLQTYLHKMSTIPVIASSLIVKRFLDPSNYTTNFLEIALQHVSMIFRSEPNWEVIEPLPDIGWRIRKHYILVKPIAQPKVRQLLSWAEFGVDMCIPAKELSAIFNLLPNIKHPNIFEIKHTLANENGSMIIQDFHEPGTLRDYLCKCKPKGIYLRKYANPKMCLNMDSDAISSYGKQILEALKFLQDKGFPYGHLHAGNVLVVNSRCQILGMANSLLGLPGYYRAFYTQLKKVQTLESIDVYSFGHLLYEMAFGRQLVTPTCDAFPPECPAHIRSVLESILTAEACKNGLPTVADLLSHPLFANVTLPPQEGKPILKIPSKLKEPLRVLKEETERRVRDDHKMIKKVLRISKAKEFHMSEEEKKKRRKTRKKAMDDRAADTSLSSTTPTTPSTPAAPSTPAPAAPAQPAAPPAPAPPAPPAPGAPAAPPPPAPSAPSAPPATSGRGALLSSISGFSKNKLKKSETHDRSAPKV